MTVIFESGYTLPGGDQPLTHARIAHANNWRTGGTATASTTATDYDADAPLNTLTYERWKPTVTTFSTWEYDHGSSVENDYCCIGAHTLGSTGSDLYVAYYNGSTWVTLASSTTLTTDEDIFVIFEPVSAQRWRIGVENGSAAPEVGVVKFGAAMQMRRPIFGGHVPINLARETTMRTNYSQTGEILGRSKRRSQLATAFEFRHLPADWVHSTFRGFQKASETEPFFIAWRPSDYGGVGFGYTTETPQPQNMGVVDLMQVTVSMRARAWD